MQEFKILEKILPMLTQREDIAVGPGDDCAAIDLGDGVCLLAGMDQMVCGLHYFPDVAPARIGAKLLKRNLSDVAAMGGEPAYALLSLASLGGQAEWFEQFFQGLEEEARQWNVSICGGDLAGLPAGKVREIMSLTILGRIRKERLCLRCNAAAGDFLYATGCFGNSLTSEHHLDFTPRLAEGQFLAGTYTRAMIDVSDGLLVDASRMAAASNMALRLDLDTIPLRPGADLSGALADGEDYELLFAVRPELAGELEKNWPFNIRLTRLGTFEKGSGVIDVMNNNLLKLKNIGYEHQFK
jgi:thiamine-monophosphate kinase